MQQDQQTVERPLPHQISMMSKTSRLACKFIFPATGKFSSPSVRLVLANA